jgi:23S rRNA (guanosine2251-2'-O)-methyltransferase
MRESEPSEREGIYVVLDGLRSAFNVGSILRTSEAAGVRTVYLCGVTAHPPNRKLEKTALGATDHVPWKYMKRTVDALAELRALRVPLIGVETVADSTPYTDFTFPNPVAIVFGHEILGISEPALAMLDKVVRIPMHGFKTTINVATASGIVLFEIVRQQRQREPDTRSG